MQLDKCEMPADAHEVGKIIGAFGVRGQFKVLPFSNDPQALLSSKRWFVRWPDGITPLSITTAKAAQLGVQADATYKLPIAQAKRHGDTLVAQSMDITDRDLAECLKGAVIYVPRESFPTPAKDEYYWVDLMGLSVVNRQGELLGVVVDLLSMGPQTTLVIDPPKASNTSVHASKEPHQPAAQCLIPFVSAFIDGVDLSAKIITVDWQRDFSV